MWGACCRFNTITGLNNDNTCAGWHSPTHGFGDTQSIAIGIQNNGIVGPNRTGPRNMRRAPMVINNAFFPRLMLNSRFVALSGNPFDSSAGFSFPSPEAMSLSSQPHLLTAQAFIPPTERTEVAGFDFVGDNDAIRAEVIERLNGIRGVPQALRQDFPRSAGRRLNHLRHVRAGDCGVSVLPNVCRCADRPFRAWSAQCLDRR